MIRELKRQLDESSQPHSDIVSDEDDRGNYERFIEIVEDRISHFKEMYHQHEAIRLTNALHEVQELIPPINFIKFASHPKDDQFE